MAELPPSFQSQPRSKTVVVAICLLLLVAVLEVIFASIALAPRILTAVKNSTQNSTAIAASSPAPFPSQTPAAPLSPVAVAPENPPENQSPKITDATPELPPQAQASDTSTQGGNALGIVSIKLDGSNDGPKKLVISMKSRTREVIDVPQVKVQVFFYDSDGTDITPSKAQSVSKWVTSGTEWKNGEPELLEVRYLPDSADSDIKFAGYVVAIYYKGDLQDYRSEPARLFKLFPLKYYIGTDE